MAKKQSKASRGARLVKVGHEVDLSEYGLNAVDKFLDSLRKVAVNGAEEALRIALKSATTCARFPAIWGDNDGDDRKAPTDPLTVYVEIDIGKDEDHPAVYKFSLVDILKDDISDCGKDGSYDGGMERISDALKKLADRIDKAIEKGRR